MVLGLLWCNVGFAEYIELNKCYHVETTDNSGAVKKMSTSFDQGNYNIIKENLKDISDAEVIQEESHKNHK